MPLIEKTDRGVRIDHDEMFDEIRVIPGIRFGAVGERFLVARKGTTYIRIDEDSLYPSMSEEKSQGEFLHKYFGER